MNVYIDWDVTLVKSNREAKIQYDFKRVYGNVTLMLRENFFSSQSSIQFEARKDDGYNFSHIPYESDTLSPTSCVINFDAKKITIKF